MCIAESILDCIHKTMLREIIILYIALRRHAFMYAYGPILSKLRLN